MPTVTYSNITELISYINTYLIPNGMRDIDGEELNNVSNGLADFIVKYAINGQLANIQTGSGAYVVSKPITIFTGNPSSVTVPDNIQNFYIFSNVTGFDIPFNTPFSYYDLYEDEKTAIPLRQSVILAKAINGRWVQVNNLSGGGSGADLPPQTGNAGRFLSTNGASAFWQPSQISLTSADFINATDCPIANVQYNKLSVFFSDASTFIYESKGQWEYLPGNTGIKILIPGFDATAYDYNFEIFLRPLNP